MSRLGCARAEYLSSKGAQQHPNATSTSWRAGLLGCCEWAGRWVRVIVLHLSFRRSRRRRAGAGEPGPVYSSGATKLIGLVASGDR
jgi:hypothetical protein